MMGQAMIDPAQENPEEFAPTRDHEYQDSHYHDEEPDIVNDELDKIPGKAASVAGKKPKRRMPPPRPRYFEE